MNLPFGLSLTADFGGKGWLFTIILITLLVLVYLTNRQRGTQAGISGLWVNLILILRSLAALILLLLVFDPEIKLTRTQEVPKKLALLIDDSASMNQAWAGEEDQLSARIREIQQQLSNTHDVELWSIDGTYLGELPKRFEKSQTNFSWAPGTRRSPGSKESEYSAAVLLSDGHINGGRSPLDQPWAEQLPVYPILALAPKSNLSIQVLDTYLATDVETRAGSSIVMKIKQSGLTGRRLELKMESDQDRGVILTNTVLKSELDDVIFPLAYTSDKDELLRFSISVEGSDLTTTAMLKLTSKKPRSNVLLISDQVNTLHKFLMLNFPDSLYNVFVDVATLGLELDPEIVATDIDLVVLNQLSSKYQNDQMLGIVKAAVKRATPTIVFLDGSTQLPKVWADLVDIEQTPGTQGAHASFLQWSQDALDHPFFLGILGLGRKSTEILNFPPIKASSFMVNTPGDPILNLGVGANRQLGLSLSNTPPRAVFNGDDIWKLFFQPSGAPLMSDLWNYLLTYMANIRTHEPVSIRGIEEFATTGAQVSFEIHVNDVEGRSLSNTELRVWQQFPDGTEQTLEIEEIRPGIYGSQVLSRQAGTQLVFAEALRYGELWGRDTSKIELVAFSGENQAQGVNEAFLSRLAAKSNGKMIRYDESELFRFPLEFYTEESALLWKGLTSNSLLIMLLTLFSVEWVIRRRQGLL